VSANLWNLFIMLNRTPSLKCAQRRPGTGALARLKAATG
jgi:hypothetical protein